MLKKLRQHIVNCSLVLMVVIAASCKKDSEEMLPDGTSTYIKDLEGDTEASVGEPEAPGSGKEKRPFYTFTFNFKSQKQQFIRNDADAAQYLKNMDWDIAFAQEYNSFVVVNNGASKVSPGYGGPGKGSMLIVDKAYDSVNEAPSDQEFTQNGIAGAGWDGGNGIGWFFYSLENHIAVPIKARTLVLKTAEGKYAKLEMQNVYKGNPAVVTDLFWPAPYLSFKYYVQEDGSRNLRTK